MPPFGLSQFAYYYGHSFWDTESCRCAGHAAAPATARSLLEYRVRGLEYAKRQAALYGYRGAQFPWEAAPTTGFETTPTFAAPAGANNTPHRTSLWILEYQLATMTKVFCRKALAGAQSSSRVDRESRSHNGPDLKSNTLWV